MNCIVIAVATLGLFLNEVTGIYRYSYSPVKRGVSIL